jgi:hypothetical protein
VLTVYHQGDDISEASVNFYETTQHNISEYYHHQSICLLDDDDDDDSSGDDNNDDDDDVDVVRLSLNCSNLWAYFSFFRLHTSMEKHG